MKYSEFISLLSLARINKYSRVAKGNKVTTLQLYHHNLQLSQRMFGVIGMCKGLKQTDVYRDLTSIREFRNRIAHHEPICFDSSKELSTQYVRHHYQLICQYIEYMGYNPKRVLKIVEKPDSVLNEIDRLARIL